MNIIGNGIDHIEKIFSQWEDRMKSIRTQVAYEAATFLLTEIKLKLPVTEDTKAYRNSLEVFQYKPIGEGFGVRVDPKSHGVGKVELDRSIIFIKAKRLLKKPSKAVLVLERYSPWTTVTLPFMPAKTDATIVYRKTSKRDVQFVTKARKSDRKVWRQQLEKVGIRVPKKPLDLGKGIKAMPDVAFIGLTLEFGLGNKPPTPHWRPALAKLRATGLNKIVNKKAIASIFSDLNYKRLETWKHKNLPVLDDNDVKQFKAFMKRLAPR